MTQIRALLLSLGFLGGFLPTVRAAERTVRQVFPVQPGCVLSVDTYRGGIVVEETEGTEVLVTVNMELTLSTEREANQALDAVKLELKQDGNHVTVQARNPRESRVRFAWSEEDPVDLSVHVSVPARCSVDLKTGSGGIVVGSLTGDMKARTDAGTIFFRRINGSIRATSGGGDVVISRCSGDLSVTTRRGSIRTGTVRGRAELKTANGDIDVQSAEGGLTAAAEAGDVTVAFPRAFSEGANVSTSAGSVFVKLDLAASCVVKASSVWGRVESTVPFVVDSGGSAKSKLEGRLNRGGPVLRLRANGGHVKIESYEEPAE